METIWFIWQGRRRRTYQAYTFKPPDAVRGAKSPHPSGRGRRSSHLCVSLPHRMIYTVSVGFLDLLDRRSVRGYPLF